MTVLKAKTTDLLDNLVREQSEQKVGNRNTELFRRTRVALEAGYEPDDVRERMTAAGKASGLDHQEVKQTIKSAVNAPSERVPDGTPAVPADQWAEVWARGPRVIGVGADKRPMQRWQYSWHEVHDETRHDGRYYAVVLPPGVLVLDIDNGAQFDASGLEESLRGAPSYHSISGKPGKGHVWFRAHKDRPYPTRTMEYRDASGKPIGADLLVGGMGIANIKDLSILDTIGSFDMLPLAPDWMQPHGNVLGTVTADMLPSGPPPPMVAGDWLHPEEGTGLYGKGGTGKGITAAYLITLLVGEGHTVMVLDYENHPREWGTRLDNLGLADGRKQVHYLSPYGRGWTATKGSIDVVSDLIREEADRLGVSYVVVDSYSAASDASSEALGGQEAAVTFAKAMTHIGRPYLMLAHVNGAAGKHSERPFGSVFVHNLCFRYSWSVEEHEAPTKSDPEDPSRPATVSLEFRNQKHNDVARADDRFLTFSFWRNGDMSVSEQTETKRQVIDMVLTILASAPNLTAALLRKAIKERYEVDVPENSIRTAITRDREKRVKPDESKVPFRYSLASSSSPESDK